MIGEPDEYNKTVSLVTVYGLFNSFDKNELLNKIICFPNQIYHWVVYLIVFNNIGLRFATNLNRFIEIVVWFVVCHGISGPLF